MAKAKILSIVILVIAIAAMGFLLYRQSQNQPTFSIGGDVTSISSDKIVVRGNTVVDGVPRTKNYEIPLKSGIKVTKQVNQNSQVSINSASVSDIKPESNEYYATQVTVFFHTDPSVKMTKPYLIQITKDARTINSSGK